MINDLEVVLKENTRCLLYADDLKLVLGVKQMADCEAMQRDINEVLQWSVANKLHFNVSKCCVMSYTRSPNPLIAQYVLGSEVIARVTTVKDLGVTFDASLTFHDHIKGLAANCYKRLGFVIRNVRDFNDPRAIKLLYTALVRSKLEAASIVWNPAEITYALLVEKVQKTFLRFLYKKLYTYYPFLYPTKYLLGSLGFNSLAVRRNYNLLVTACGVLRGETDCPELVGRTVRLAIPFVPKNLLRPRSHKLLAVPITRTVAHKNSPAVRALRLLNSLLSWAPDCDMFASRWTAVYQMCLRYCEVMDER